jgi:hypothetical protein
MFCKSLMSHKDEACILFSWGWSQCPYLTIFKPHHGNFFLFKVFYFLILIHQSLTHRRSISVRCHLTIKLNCFWISTLFEEGKVLDSRFKGRAALNLCSEISM